MAFFGAACRCVCVCRLGEQKAPHPSYNLSHISYNDEAWHSYTLPKEDPKNDINDVTHALTSADISIFFEKSLNFATLRNTAIDCILLHNLSYF